MRFILAGLITLSLAAAAGAQATGDVESVGFGGGYYRPGVWNPMLVRLRATSGATGNYRLEVVQEDLDRDHAHPYKQIILQGNPEGVPPQDQRFWIYFQPEPTPEDKGGLPQDKRGPDLNSSLKVFLCTEKGKQLQQLDVTQSIHNIDSGSRDTKLVLFITAQSKPILSEFATALGMNEDLLPITIGEQSLARSLPENVIGYDAVDAIVWMDANPQYLSGEQETAIRQYVRRGGRLVVCQTGRPVLWQTIYDRWADLLPITVSEIGRTAKLDALGRIAETASDVLRDRDHLSHIPVWEHFWSSAKGPFDLAHAKAKPGAYVAETDGDWPYIVRGVYGRGGVTWVAQDLGDAKLTGIGEEAEKWLYVWNKVFDWPSDPTPNFETLKIEQQPALRRYESRGGAVDLGFAEKNGLELGSKGAALVALALLFFILYWAVAGPGSYLVLVARKRSGFSWGVFALIALAAIGVTLLIVRLVLRQAPELTHVSYVSISPGSPALVRSEIGLYITRDDDQKLELKETSSDSPSYITVYPIHPSHLSNSEGYTAYQEYYFPVDDPKADSRSIIMPYRSSLKKFEACWVGELPGVEGTAYAVQEGNKRISGTLVNKTGRLLNNVYLVFRYPRTIQPNGPTTVPATDDTVYYLSSSWVPDGSLDLDAIFGKLGIREQIMSKDAVPGAGHNLWGSIVRPDMTDSQASNWNNFWYNSLHSDMSAYENRILSEEDSGRPPLAFPMLSLFDRLPTISNKDMANAEKEWSRFDLLRRGKRQLDVSPAVSAGQLVILAQANGELPIPLEVEGDSVKGHGTLYYQFILPLDRTKLSATTKPTTTQTTQASTDKKE